MGLFPIINVSPATLVKVRWTLKNEIPLVRIINIGIFLEKKKNFKQMFYFNIIYVKQSFSKEESVLPSPV